MLKKIAQNIDSKYLNPASIRTGLVLGSIQTNNNAEDYVVTKLFYRTNDYAIFEVNNSGYVEYISVNDEIYNTQAISLPLNRINFWLYGTPQQNFYGFQESFADSLAMCFEGKSSEALFSIAQLEAMVKNEVFKSSKFIYISTFAGLCSILLICSVLFKYTDPLDKHIDGHFKSLFYICTMGALGGLLSVSRNLDSYNVEIKSKIDLWSTFWGPHLVGITTRLSVAILGAFFIYVLASAKIINTSLDLKSSESFFILMALATAAGFSESLIPGLLTKFETNISAGEPLRVKQTSNQITTLGPGALNPMASNSLSSTTTKDKSDNDDDAEG